MTASILAIIAGLLAAIPLIAKWIADFRATKKISDAEAVQQKSDETFKPLEQGNTTSEEKDAAAKNIADLISGK